MKRFKMPSKREFQAMYPPKDDAFDRAVRAALDALPDDGTERRPAMRKVSVILAAAVILLLALACAAVAAGLGAFGKLAEQTASEGYSELYRALDEKSTTLDNVQNVGDADGQTFRLTQAYADGDSLFVAYELTGMQTTADYDVYLGDSAYLAGTDEYLTILSGEDTLREDGVMVGMKEFELPETLKNETSIALDFVLYRAAKYDVFDGEQWVRQQGERTETRIRVDVPLNANEATETYHAERTFPSYRVAVDVTISDVKIHVKAHLTSLDGHPLGREKLEAGEMMDGGLYLGGQPMNPISGMDEGLETTDWTMENDYTRPEQLPEKLEWIPCYYTETGTEDRNEEAVTIWLMQP